MCGSTDKARLSAFASALAFFNEQASKQTGDVSVPATGETRKVLQHVAAIGGPDAPPEFAALADAEDTVAVLVREIQLTQTAIIGALLTDGGVVTSYGASVETLVALLNNLEVALHANAQAIAVVQRRADELGVNEDSPVTLQ